MPEALLGGYPKGEIFGTRLGYRLPEDRPLINGGSVIVSPLGDILAGPLTGETGLLTAEINTDDLVGARYDFDSVGHYARPDIFTLHVDTRAKDTVKFLEE